MVRSHGCCEHPRHPTRILGRMADSKMKHVLVTGASRGIGRAIAQDLGLDHHIIVGGAHRDSVQAVVDQLPSAEPFVCDLADEDATARTVSKLTRLDALVNCAGMGNPSPGNVDQLNRATWRQVLELNVVAVADLTRLVLPLLRQAHGDIVMMNSGSGWNPPKAGGGCYGASKYALRALTYSLREEERGAVRVISIHPGRVDTQMQVDLQAAAGRQYDPDDHLRPDSIAATVRAAIEASPESMLEEISIRPVAKL